MAGIKKEAAARAATVNPENLNFMSVRPIGAMLDGCFQIPADIV